MNILDELFIVFWCFAREDGRGDRHKRAIMALEMIGTFFLSFITMVAVGFFNLRLSSIILWGLVIGGHGVINYWFFNRYFIRSKRYLKLAGRVENYRKRKKWALAFFAVLLLVFSFGLLIGGGILMSYLLSQH